MEDIISALSRDNGEGSEMLKQAIRRLYPQSKSRIEVISTFSAYKILA
jgi:hypothetical protein